MAGHPEKAKELLEQAVIDPSGLCASDWSRNKSVLDGAERARLRKAIDAAIIAKMKARSIMARAAPSVQPGDMTEVTELLEEAFSIYDRDHFIILNLAFALSRSNEFEGAGKLLISVATIVPSSLAKICYANTAFNEIRASRLELVIPLLEATASLVMAENAGQEGIDFLTLPGIGGWIGETGEDDYFLLEEPIGSAHKLIDTAIKHYSENIPLSVKHLAEWYSKAAIELKRL